MTQRQIEGHDGRDLVVVEGLLEDGNVFALMGKARQALRRAGRSDDAKELTERVTSSHGYDVAVSIIMEYAIDAAHADDFDTTTDGDDDDRDD